MRGFTLIVMALVLLPSVSWMSRAADDVKPGLVAEYYDWGKAIEDFPTIPEDKKPSIKRVDKQVNVDDTTEYFNGTDLKDHFFVKWSGSVKIEKAGKVTFHLESDDGSRLYVDGKLVVNNPGLHPMERKSGEIELSAGQHEIKLEYFQNEGGSGCKLLWKLAGGNDEVIPEGQLWHKAADEK